jgi:cytochrome c oxidase assembly factor CtaG
MPFASSPMPHSQLHHSAMTFLLGFLALIYMRGWLHSRRIVPNALSSWSLPAIWVGLLCAWIAVGSPLATLDHEWLSVHMIQHLVLMTVSAPLILLGAFPLLFFYSLPPGFTRGILGPGLRVSPVQSLARAITNPFFCWLVAMGVLIGWHVPAAYTLALNSPTWHNLEHASFFLAGVFFWWPVIEPWPRLSRYSRWYIVMYLFLATLPCDALSACLAFCDKVVYRCYLSVPHLNMSAMQDQQCAGALMWVFVTFAYLLPAVLLTANLLGSSDNGAGEADVAGLFRRAKDPELGSALSGAKWH